MGKGEVGEGGQGGQEAAAGEGEGAGPGAGVHWPPGTSPSWGGLAKGSVGGAGEGLGTAPVGRDWVTRGPGDIEQQLYWREQIC